MSDSASKKHTVLTCKECGHKNEFYQPYPYHAGFGNSGFLYNEAGNATLVWSVYDPYFRNHFGGFQLWPPRDEEIIKKFEQNLPPSPNGDRWSFDAPARCTSCKAQILPSMREHVYYLVYPHTIDLHKSINSKLGLEFYVNQAS